MTESVKKVSCEILRGEKSTLIWQIKGYSQQDKFKHLRTAKCSVDIGSTSSQGNRRREREGPSTPARLHFYFKKSRSGIHAVPPVGSDIGIRQVDDHYLDLYVDKFYNENNQIVEYQFEVSLVDEQLNEIKEWYGSQCNFPRTVTSSYLLSTDFELCSKFINLKIGYLAVKRPTTLRIKLVVTTTFECIETVVGGNLPNRGESPVATSFRHHQSAHYSRENYPESIELETKDGKIFSASRLLLAARSPVFHDLIKKELDDNGFRGTVKLLDVTSRSMEAVLEFMNSGQLPPTAGECIGELVKIGFKYGVSGLLDTLNRKMITFCNTGNMFLLHQIALKNGMSSTAAKIARFIRDN